MITLEFLATVITVVISTLALCGGIFQFAVIRPLENAIASLNKSIDRLDKTLVSYETRLRLVEQQVVEINQRVRSNQHRIDALEEKIK